MSALGTPNGNGPGGIFVMDHETFEPLGKWEVDRGPQQLSYDFWWHLGHDTMISGEWGTPNMVEDGCNPEILLRSEEHTSELQSRQYIVCRLLLEKKNKREKKREFEQDREKVEAKSRDD